MTFISLSRLRNVIPAVAGLGLALCVQTPASADDKIHLVIEQYPPYNYEENGELKGIAVELVEGVMQHAGIDYDIELMPWARAIALAENQKDYCVFTTVHTEERHNRFQWVEPLVTARNYLTKRKGSDVNPQTLEEATQYLIGTQRGDYTVGVLESKGFTRLDLTSEIDLTLNKLLKDRVDLMPMADGLVREKQEEGVDIEPILVLVSVINSVACNRQTSSDTIAKMQASLETLTADGTRDRIFAKYDFAESDF